MPYGCPLNKSAAFSWDRDVTPLVHDYNYFCVLSSFCLRFAPFLNWQCWEIKTLNAVLIDFPWFSTGSHSGTQWLLGLIWWRWLSMSQASVLQRFLDGSSSLTACRNKVSRGHRIRWQGPACKSSGKILFLWFQKVYLTSFHSIFPEGIWVFGNRKNREKWPSFDKRSPLENPFRLYHR